MLEELIKIRKNYEEEIEAAQDVNVPDRQLRKLLADFDSLNDEIRNLEKEAARIIARYQI